MSATVNDSRVDQIIQCTNELERCRKEYPKMFLVTVGQMDWITELHRLIWEWEDK